MLTGCELVLHHCDMREVPVRCDVTIEQATEIWLSGYSSPNTRAAYSSDLRAFLGWCGNAPGALNLTWDELNGYRAEREAAGASSATLSRQFAALRAFYDSACELGVCRESPFGAREQAATGASGTGNLTGEEVALLLEASSSDARTNVLVQLLLQEGLRLAETLALDHADVTGPRHAKRLRIVRHGDAIDVTVGPVASRSLGVLERTSPGPGPLFTGPSRGRAGPVRLTRFGADHLIKRAAAAAGIRGPVSANVLRRTHVTFAHKAGVPIEEIRHSMGHRDVRTTRRYMAPTNTNQPHPERS